MSSVNAPPDTDRVVEIFTCGYWTLGHYRDGQWQSTDGKRVMHSVVCWQEHQPRGAKA